MSLTMGPNTGLLTNGAPGEGHYNELMRLLRWDDFLRQPVVKGRGRHLHFYRQRCEPEPHCTLVGDWCEHAYLGVHAAQAGLAGAGGERGHACWPGQDV